MLFNPTSFCVWLLVWIKTVIYMSLFWCTFSSLPQSCFSYLSFLTGHRGGDPSLWKGVLAIAPPTMVHFDILVYEILNCSHTSHPACAPSIYFCLVEGWSAFDNFCRRTISQSCPFCRDNLKRVNSGDLWVFTDNRDVVDMATVTRENLRRLFMYIDKLPLIVPDSLFDTYDSHIR